MNIVFMHQAFPGRFRYLASHAASIPGNRVVGIGLEGQVSHPSPASGIEVMTYAFQDGPRGCGPDYLEKFATSVIQGRAATRQLLTLRYIKGFVPDVICVHPAWGEGLFLRELFPETPLLMYCEFHTRYYKAEHGFDPEFPLDDDAVYRSVVWQAEQKLSLYSANACLSPTRWQASSFPEYIRNKTQVIHEGIVTDYMRPDDSAVLTLQRLAQPGESRVADVPAGSGLTPEQDPWQDPGMEAKGSPITLRRGDKVVTFVSPSLEPARGFHTFMRSLPLLQSLQPDAHILIAGGDAPGHSPALPDGRTYKAALFESVAGSLDLSRVHFLDVLPTKSLRDLFRISSAHVYFTTPAVLSWSVLEAMSCGCLVVGSDTAPVREVIRNGHNGLLTGFFDHEALARTVADALDRPGEYAALRENARATVVEQYEINTCLQRQMLLLQELAEGKYPTPR